MSRLKNNREAWEKIFQDFDVMSKINEDGFFKITSKQINVYREARLMTKFDNSEAIPEILRKNQLSILPVSSNCYMIAKFETYKKFEEKPKEIEKIEFPQYIESLDCKNITSEALALNCAYISKILEDFLGEENLLPTVSGKMGSGNFEFEISQKNSNSKINVTVENSRMEIDGGYEGVKSLALVEVKNVIADDFLIRQLYYPYRLWSEKVKKVVRPIFVVFSNGIFTIYEYKFNNKNEYCSIELVKCKRYSIEDTEIDLDTIKELTNDITILKSEPEVSFPQANSFERIINLCEILKNSEKEKHQITEIYEFDSRQTNYYTDAGIYLGLIEKKGNRSKSFKLTELGNKILNLNYKKRQLEFAKLILSHEIFNKVIKEYFKNFEMPSDKKIVENMKECNLYNISSKSTYYRRASTVKSWINWIVNLATKC